MFCGARTRSLDLRKFSYDLSLARICAEYAVFYGSVKLPIRASNDPKGRSKRKQINERHKKSQSSGFSLFYIPDDCRFIDLTLHHFAKR